MNNISVIKKKKTEKDFQKMKSKLDPKKLIKIGLK